MRGASRAVTFFAACAAPVLVGAECGGGDGSGGSPPSVVRKSPDSRCIALADLGGFPPGYDFVPGPAGEAPDRVVAGTASRSQLIPLGVEQVPFQMPPGSSTYTLPSDADGDGNVDFFKSIDGVHVVDHDLALVTVSGALEAVLFVEPAVVGPLRVEVSVPVDFDPVDFVPFPGLPAPGGIALQTGITTTACIAPPPLSPDSRGAPILISVPSGRRCIDAATPSYPASFTSGAALIGDRLFASMSNVGGDQGLEDTQFLPGAVVVYELDRASDPPRVGPTTATPDGRPYVLTTPGAAPSPCGARACGFNPTHVTAYETPAGRRFVLVTQTGAIGIRADDPGTPGLEGGAVPITDGAIDVIDADALVLVATIPIRGGNPSFGELAIDPSGRIALFGDVNARHVYGVDLTRLQGLGPAVPGAPPAVLEDAVLYDGRSPVVIPALPGGAPFESCPGQIESVAFTATGATAFVVDGCDGSLAALAVDVDSLVALGAACGSVCARVTDIAALAAPLRADTLGLLRRPAGLAVRPGIPGVDFSGPDLFFTIGDPEGFLCGLTAPLP